MVIALYNAAVEMEHLGSIVDAVEYDQEALQVHCWTCMWLCACIVCVLRYVCAT